MKFQDIINYNPQQNSYGWKNSSMCSNVSPFRIRASLKDKFSCKVRKYYMWWIDSYERCNTQRNKHDASD